MGEVSVHSFKKKIKETRKPCVIRSVSFPHDVFTVIEERRGKTKRSTFLAALVRSYYGMEDTE